MFRKKPAYKRVLLKCSGWALAGDTRFGIDPLVLMQLAKDIYDLISYGVEVGIVIGGGNFFRGELLVDLGITRITGDQMGMLGTVINALALRDACEKVGFVTHIMSAIEINGVAEFYSQRLACSKLKQKHVVIFAGGTGNPLVTTDSAASLRAIEINADLLIKATNVDGIYSSDPRKDHAAIKYDRISYNKVLEEELGVMDLAAFVQCKQHNMPICVFNVHKPGALMRIVQGESEGTMVLNSGEY